MKTKEITHLLLAALLAMFIAGSASADVVIYTTGNYMECTIVGVDETRVTARTEYGEHKFLRSELLGWFQKELGKDGSEFYRGGELLVQRGMMDQAAKLFEKAIQLNPAYSEPAQRAMAGGYSGTMGETGPAGPRIHVAGPTRGITQSLVCPVCAGEGKLKREYETLSGRTIINVIPCWFCDAKGLRIVTIPGGFRSCPNCSGWGYTEGKTDTSKKSTFGQSSGGGTSAFKSKVGELEYREPCWQCEGKGYIGAPQAVITAMGSSNLMAASQGGGSMGYTSQPTGPGGPTRNTSMSRPTYTEDEEEEDEEEEEEEEEEEANWFKSNMKLILIIGGAALLIVILILSQSSKK